MCFVSKITTKSDNTINTSTTLLSKVLLRFYTNTMHSTGVNCKSRARWKKSDLLLVLLRVGLVVTSKPHFDPDYSGLQQNSILLSSGVSG